MDFEKGFAFGQMCDMLGGQYCKSSADVAYFCGHVKEFSLQSFKAVD